MSNNDNQEIVEREPQTEDDINTSWQPFYLGSGDVRCPVEGCEKVTKMMHVKKDGTNKGRLFFKCGTLDDPGCGRFAWMDTEAPSARSSAKSPANVNKKRAIREDDSIVQTQINMAHIKSLKSDLKVLLERVPEDALKTSVLQRLEQIN